MAQEALAESGTVCLSLRMKKQETKHDTKEQMFYLPVTEKKKYKHDVDIS